MPRKARYFVNAEPIEESGLLHNGNAITSAYLIALDGEVRKSVVDGLASAGINIDLLPAGKNIPRIIYPNT